MAVLAALALHSDVEVETAGSEGLTLLQYVLRRAFVASQSSSRLRSLMGPGCDRLCASQWAVASGTHTMAGAKGTATISPNPPANAAATGVQFVRLIPSDASHPGAGACYIDGGVPAEALTALEALFLRMLLRVDPIGQPGSRTSRCLSPSSLILPPGASSALSSAPS